LKASYHSRKPKVNFQEQSSDEDVLRETIERFNSMQPELITMDLGPEPKAGLKIRRNTLARQRSTSKLLKSKDSRKTHAEEMMR
jgi:hypothetical protein